MVISGSGSLPGGDYNEEVRISGSGVINGNISCTEFSISGSGEVRGNICAAPVIQKFQAADRLREIWKHMKPQFRDPEQ